MPSTVTELALPYAEPGVRTAPPRTLLRVVGRRVWSALRFAGRLLQLILLGVGYAVLGVAFVVRLVLVCVAVPLLMMGRLRWNGQAVRLWVVRTFNRAWIVSSDPFRRHRDRVPLATPQRSR